MKKLSFRNLITVNVFLIYIAFSTLLFVIFNSLYYDIFKQKFTSETRFAAIVVNNTIEEEKKGLIKTAKIIANDEVVYQAFQNNINIGVKWLYKDGKLISKFPEMDKMQYMQLANIEKRKMFDLRGEERGVALYKYNGKTTEFASCSMEFEKIFIDEANASIFQNIIGNNAIGGQEISTIEEKKGQYYMKGMAPIGRNNRAYDGVPLGIVVVGGMLNNELLQEIRKKINKEILLIKENKIITSTIYENPNIIKGLNLPKTINAENIYTYNEVEISSKKMAFVFLPILNFDGKVIGFIGTGYYLDDMKILYKKSAKDFLLYEIIFSLILFAILYLGLNSIFAPFNKLLLVIKKITEGKYDERLRLSGRTELDIMINSINKLSEAVDKRESELKELNSNLEKIVEQRTEELNVRNSQLNKINNKMNNELDMAKKLHSKITKVESMEFKNFNIYYENFTSSGIGGDFVDCIDLKNGKKGVILADVAGNGVAASLMISALKLIINLYFKEIESASEALYVMNDIIIETFAESITVNFTYLIIDDKNNTIEVASGSQEDILLIREEMVQTIPEKGIILGVINSDEIRSNDRISYNSAVLTLKNNEKLFLYTDGLVENNIFEREELIVFLAENGSKSVEEIFKLLRERIDAYMEREGKDDISFMFIQNKIN